MIEKNKAKVLAYLKSGNTLTAMDGFEKFNIVSVRDYVSMIRLHDGIDVKSEWRISDTLSRRVSPKIISARTLSRTSLP